MDDNNQPPKEAEIALVEKAYLHLTEENIQLIVRKTISTTYVAECKPWCHIPLYISVSLEAICTLNTHDLL